MEIFNLYQIKTDPFPVKLASYIFIPRIFLQFYLQLLLGISGTVLL